MRSSDSVESHAEMFFSLENTDEIMKCISSWFWGVQEDILAKINEKICTEVYWYIDSIFSAPLVPKNNRQAIKQKIF